MKMMLKRAVAVLLTAVIILCAAPVAGLTGLFVKSEAVDHAVGDIVEFGSYPQSEVTDSSTVSALNAAPQTWVSYRYMSGAGTDWCDGSAQASDYMQYCDVTAGKEKYRGVKFSTYRPYYTNYKSTTSTDNTLQDNNGYKINTTYWFKYEPLKWRVLDPSEGLVLCENIIDSQAYSNTFSYYNNAYRNSTGAYACDYESSSIRAWLNDEFYNTAFDSSQQSKIKKTHLENKSAYSSTYDSADTDDKVFLLSHWDAINTKYGFSSSSSTYDINRRAQGTDYAKCQGLDVYRNSGSVYNGNSSWWLLSPNGYDRASTVIDNGYAGSYYYNSVYMTYIGVRPALKITNLASLISQSYFNFSQTHTVDAYRSANAEYKNKYFAGAGVPLDGSNGNPDFCIPGLSSVDNLVPQGCGYDKDNNVIYITSDSNAGKGSMLFALNGTTGDMLGEYRLMNSSKEAITGHVGGVAVSDGQIYIADGQSIYHIPVNSLNGDKAVVKDIKDMKPFLGNAECSYLSITDGKLLAGNFYNSEVEKYRKPADKNYNSIIVEFDLKGSGEQQWQNFKVQNKPTKIYYIDNRIENIQSAVITDGKLMFTSSYNRHYPSTLYITDASNVVAARENVLCAKGLPMMEGSFVRDGYLYTMCESAAWKYHGEDKKDLSASPTDVIWKIDYKSMIPILQEERDAGAMSFGNWSGYSGFKGKKYGMSDLYAKFFVDNQSFLDSLYYLTYLLDRENHKWNGSCFGIAAVSALMKAGKLHPGFFQHDASVSYDLDSPYNSITVESLVNYYYLMQLMGSTPSDIQGSSEERKNAENIVNALKASKYPVIISFNIMGYSGKTHGSHAVLGYDMTTENGYYKIKIIDSNKVARFLFIKTDFSDSYFTDGTQKRNTYNFDDGSKYYKFLCSGLTVENSGNNFDKYNIESQFKKLGAVSGVVKKAKAARASSDNGRMVLITNYQNFIIEDKRGNRAVIVNGKRTEGTIDVQLVRVLNDAGTELKIMFSVPDIEADDIYTITPNKNEESVLTGEIVDKYSTIFKSGNMGSTGSVVTDSSSSVIISGDNYLTSSSENSNTTTEVSLSNVDLQSEWKTVTLSQSTQMLTVGIADNSVNFESSENGSADITVEDFYNKTAINDVQIESNKEYQVDENVNGETVITDDGENEIAKTKLGKSVIFYSNSSVSIDSLTDIEIGSKINAPEIPERNGYVFDGWYLTPDLQDGTKWDFDRDIVNGNICLYAKWDVFVGDVNSDGNINSSDALMVLQHSVGLENLTGDRFSAADVNKDTLINSSDALMILQYSVGIITTF